MLVGGSVEHAHVAVLEDGDLVEHYVTRKSRPSLVGNVYLGRVQNVLPGMEAAFVDIGQPRNAVLYVGELIGEEELEGGQQPPRIEQVLRSGQQILVQVTKDPMGTKGARLTTMVSLAGRYLVLVPNGTGYGISKKLPDDERSRLRDIARSIRPDGYSLIVRTAAQGAQADELQRDLDRLVRLWQEIDKRRGGKAPVEIYVEPDLVIRVVRDLFGKDFGKLVIEDPDVHDRVMKYIQAVDPDLAQHVELHQGPLSMFDTYHVTEQLRKALERKVWLPSGGYIVVDRTEALTVVDVNSGRYVSGKTLEDTVVKVNLEAAEEVVRQLRLRDIGGIIVIDFIDMLKAQNREEILRAFREALAKDKTKTQVIGISPLGLVEMTRKNVSEGLVEALSTPCPTCEGRGVVIEGDLA
ncbi:MAG TPA: Rne/Rng family ribonuclease [Actinomycetota bacterium]|jgi:ribonuclease E|nr:Rne/Rng family ribonuclease [Actinomycetota bacterium]